MGWNTCALFMERCSSAAAVQLLTNESPAVATGSTVDAATAMSSDVAGTLYVAESQGWCQIWDPEGTTILGVADSFPENERNRVLAVIFGSVSSTYGFMFYKDGILARQAFYVDGQLVSEDGDPLPIETDIHVPEWGPDEDFLWTIITAVTGIKYDEELRFAGYAML